ncbi:DNA-directed RNA polymerase I subunit RPA34.5-domain-containing protein [Xylaria sp. FL1777]|nr:DNA-directed RNA polymerase I subunit RPA34.5-domain-containing protein [Xylaria sp. FL1777]
MRSSKANIGSLSSMASKVRQEKKNSAAAKAKTPLARARESKKSFKSAETVVDSSSDSDSSAASASDSDNDSGLDAARAKFLARKGGKQTKAAEVTTNGVKHVATPAKPVSKGSIPTSAQKPADKSSSASDSESDSDTSSSGSSSPTSHMPVASQNKSAATKAKSKNRSSSSSSSGSSSDSEGASTQNKVAKTKTSSKESEESDSTSDDEDIPNTITRPTAQGAAKNAASVAQEPSGQERDSDDEGDGDRMAVERINGDDATTESTSQVSRAQWLNNGDFMLRKASSGNPGKEVADFFSNANLDGKQVWYFTAPASLPITVLKDMEIDLSKVTKGEALLNHNGDDYGLDLESYATNTQIQLLIPSRGGDKYASLNHGVDSTIHLRRMAKFGPGGEVHATATDNYVPVPKPIREQPQDLRVRYTPIGVPSPVISSAVATKKSSVNAPSSKAKTKVGVHFPSNSDSESDSESDVEMTTPTALATPASQSKSAKSGLANGVRKRKHPGNEDQGVKRIKAEQTTEVPSAKKQIPVQTPTSSATPSHNPSAKSKDKKGKAKKDKTPKSVVMTPTPAKQTPVPLPSYPGMKR